MMEVSQLAKSLGWVDNAGNSVDWVYYNRQRRRTYYKFEEVETEEEADYFKQNGKMERIKREREVRGRN